MKKILISLTAFLTITNITNAQVESLTPAGEYQRFSKEFDSAFQKFIKNFGTGENLSINQKKSLLDVFKAYKNFSQAYKDKPTITVSKKNGVNLTDIIKELRTYSQALTAFYMDTHHFPAFALPGKSMLDASELIQDNKLDGWKGPYIKDLKESEIKGVLKHKNFKNLAIFVANNKNWSDPMDANASCDRFKDCSVYICYSSMLETDQKSLDTLLDQVNSPDQGLFRYTERGFSCKKSGKYK